MISTWLLSALVLIPACAWLLEATWLARTKALTPASSGRETKLSSALRTHAEAIRVVAALFPPIAIVGMLLSFVGKGYVVQSQSMVPGLVEGDVVAAIRYELGWSVPGSHHRYGRLRDLRPGDVVVFRYPLDPSQIYVKRVVGLAGDTISYDIERGFTINGQAVPSESVPKFHFYETGLDYPQFVERLGSTRYEVITYNTDHRPAALEPAAGFVDEKACRYTSTSLTCRVPEGAYFVVGDNRDRSEDSREWGFVPEDALLGRVILRFGNWNNLWGKFASVFAHDIKEPR